MLRRFVAIKTISGDLQCIGSGRDGALFLKEKLNQLGAATHLVDRCYQCDDAARSCNMLQLACGEGKNPIVIGRLDVDQRLMTVVIYGHYDTVPAESVQPVDNKYVCSLMQHNCRTHGTRTRLP